ncbi:MAG: hypothetical protein KGZ83_03105 [Sulfuricella sp.]|nr:hypothetical protein [Sulfuricella sp.]
MKKKLIAGLVILALVAGGVVLVKKKREQLAAEPPPASLPVVIEEKVLQAGAVSLSLRNVVEVQALRDTVLASRLTAYVTELPLYEGERFKKGALLAKLDVSQADADLQRADASLAQTRLQESTLAADLAAAESTLKAEQERTQRLQTLYKIQGVSLEQVQTAEAVLAGVRARFAAASAAMQNFKALLQANSAAREAAKENLRYAMMTAPFDGVVSQRLAQPGDLATPGKPLLKIVDVGAGVRLLVNVPERLQPVALLLGEQRLKLQAWPEAGQQGLRRYEARAAGGAWVPGSRVEAQVVVFQSDKAVFLPRTCLLNDDGKTAGVVQLHDGKATVKKLTLAASGEEGAATRDEGLAGQHIACASPDILARLAAGAPFKPANGQR